MVYMVRIVCSGEHRARQRVKRKYSAFGGWVGKLRYM